MANFAHNRRTKADQERLLRERLDSQHDFRGAFDDSGNFAFASRLGQESLRADVLAALRTEFKVKWVMVVARTTCTVALQELERIAFDSYGSRFLPANYAVNLHSRRWRLGLVFVNAVAPLEREASSRLRRIREDDLKVLNVRDLMVGVLKYDQGRRIPWGVPAGYVERALGASRRESLATGRSAKTVRGALGLFSRVPRESTARGTHRAGHIQEGTAAGTTAEHSSETLTEFAWLQEHPELQKVGPAMHQAFIALARKVWEDSCGQIAPRAAGQREKHVPFSRIGEKGNLADLRVRRGVIRLALKIPMETLASSDPGLRTVPIQERGRWRPYSRAFDFP